MRVVPGGDWLCSRCSAAGVKAPAAAERMSSGTAAKAKAAARSPKQDKPSSGDGGSGGGSGGGAARVRVWSVPPWLSILPPVATLLLAVWLRQVMVGLLVGIWLGATIAYGGNPLTG